MEYVPAFCLVFAMQSCWVFCDETSLLIFLRTPSTARPRYQRRLTRSARGPWWRDACCAVPGGRIWRSTAHNICTEMVLLPCAFCSVESIRLSGRTATRTLPTYTCTVSHLQQAKTKLRNMWNRLRVLDAVLKD